MTYSPLPTHLQTVHETCLGLVKSVKENRTKTDILRDVKKSDVEAFDWLANGERIVSCTRDGALKVWNAQRMMEERSWAGSWTWVEAHPSDSNVFCAVSWDGKVKIGDVRSAAVGLDIDIKKSKNFDKFLAVTWKLDGKHVSVLTRSDVIHTVNVDSGDVTTVQPGCEVYCIMYDAMDRLWVGTGGTPGRIMVYTDGVLTDDFVAHSHITSCLARSRDNQFMISGGSDALVALWDCKSHACLKTFPNSLSPVTSVSASADASMVSWGSGAIGAKDGEPVLSMAGMQTGVHYLSHVLQAPVSKVKWHPTRNVVAYSLQQVNNADPSIHILSFPSLEQA